ncbi:MAG: gliding motility lipoprotein GldD [Winogradskyella sp.]|nr:gliding motility lipoprotein GldD [Winogradskyella sp.]NNF85133.1 gliding motility lipoprotein GldD [Winogradskyella sp.]NNL81779.1 gliding motility lipoprotein GldD [Winogradskyella sp.]
MKKIIISLSLYLLVSCGDNPIPKPNAYLRLDYPDAVYKTENPNMPFSFEKNTAVKTRLNSKTTSDGTKGIDLEYTALKATIYMTYKPVSDHGIRTLLMDAQNLTQKHTIKADEIVSAIYENPKKRVFGMFYEIGGDAASQAQFYVTDSINHFINGSLYFYAKPNYDSIYPSAEYLKKDMKRIMESIEWKE